MALFSPSSSPNINVREIDLTGSVPGVTTSTGAFVGDFRWGPIAESILIDNETNLIANFGSPNADTAVDFLSAAAFLKYSDSLFVVREAVTSGDIGDSCLNAYNGTATSTALVKNLDDWVNKKSVLAADGHTYLAKWGGDAGNGVRVEVCPYSVSDTVFEAWAYKDNFDAAPTTSSWTGNLNGFNDEVHVSIIDSDGTFTGTPGTVLETFPFVSLASDAKTNDGSSNYFVDVLNNKSDFVWSAQPDSDLVVAGAGSLALNKNFVMSVPAVQVTALDSGQNSGAFTPAQYANGFALFEDINTILVDFLIAPGLSDSAAQKTVVENLVNIAGNERKDCVVVASPNKDSVVGNSTPAASSIATVGTWSGSSYLVVDNNYLKVYDKYNDQYVYIPASPITAGIMAGTDAVAAPWFSPAGTRRGQYFGVTSLAYNPSKSDRDSLYRIGINPIVNLPGQGITLFGDKTKESRPSAFDRINVRRLFLGIERAIKGAARNVMFEFNDEFTRAEFVGTVEPFLREIQGRRGITDFRVVCDETNNTASVIDTNRFVASIFIKPARSINYITLNFVAVRTGVEFEEITGAV